MLSSHFELPLSKHKDTVGVVNGRWSRWSPWSSCSQTCGTGEQRRQRSCDNPEPANGGRHCKGEEVDQRKCENSQTCSGIIVDSKLAREKYPYMARLGKNVFFHRNNDKNAYLLFFLAVFGGTTVCDGTVIGERFVVTARHGCAEACPKECSRDWNKCAISLSCYVQLR